MRLPAVSSALPLRSAATTLAEIVREAAGCRRCDLWRHATQTVFGEGPPDAAMMLVGEQPGDEEDRAGRPFVGPAGRVLDAALQEAGIDRDTVYITNAVKHFKNEPRGKRRLHRTPNAGEVQACRWWLDRERSAIAPRVIVALGATAARAVLRKAVVIGQARGWPIELGNASAFVTVHPSYLLRIPDAAAKARERERFVADLRAAAALLTG